MIFKFFSNLDFMILEQRSEEGRVAKTSQYELTANPIPHPSCNIQKGRQRSQE